MNGSPSSGPSGSARRLVVALVVATTAAAVTAGMVLNERHPGERPLANADAGQLRNGEASPVPLEMRRHSPLAETAATLAAEPTGAEGARGDPSLPAAAEALKNAGGAAGEPAPTF